MNKESIKVRFAPSPTGFLHVGGLRTALFNFLFARKLGGSFLLRIEDTDKSREVAGAKEDIIRTLQNFGLGFEGEPYVQSEHLDVYKKFVEMLLEKGVAYKCYCTEERIEELKKQAELQKTPFKYDKHCLKNPETREKYVIRQNIPEEGLTEFKDLIHGEIKIENRQLDDGILIKSDGWPIYNFANVVDDHLMGITHVIRGEEFIPSTPKHILLYKAFGWGVPEFAHLPLILDKERKKLSKRTGDVAVKEYIEQGYLKEALLNFIAFLGWNPKTEKEIFSHEELIAAFELAKINKAAAVFDLGKLNFINREWQKRLNLGTQEPMYKRTKELLKKRFGEINPDFFDKIWPLVFERVKGPSELDDKLPEFSFFFTEPEYEKGLLRWQKMTDEDVRNSLQKSLKIISNFQFPISKEEIEKDFFELIGTGDRGALLWPLRVALTGLKASPGPFEIIEVFLAVPDGNEIILKRIKTAIDKLSNL